MQLANRSTILVTPRKTQCTLIRGLSAIAKKRQSVAMHRTAAQNAPNKLNILLLDSLPTRVPRSENRLIKKIDEEVLSRLLQRHSAGKRHAIVAAVALQNLPTQTLKWGSLNEEISFLLELFNLTQGFHTRFRTAPLLRAARRRAPGGHGVGRLVASAGQRLVLDPRRRSGDLGACHGLQSVAGYFSGLFKPFYLRRISCKRFRPGRRDLQRWKKKTV